ncbi:MAG: hypothetical protein ABIG39_06350 [Candidatus Micrarchaeota archaeon]
MTDRMYGKEGEPADALFVYIPRKVKFGRTDLDESVFEHFHRTFTNETMFVQGLSDYVMQNLDAQIRAMQALGIPDREINSALNGLFRGKSDSELGKNLHPDEFINTLALAKGLSELGATEREISVNWVKKTLNGMKEPVWKLVPGDIETYFKNRYSLLFNVPAESLREDAFFKKVSLNIENASLEDRIGNAAMTAKRMDSMGFSVMGPYKKYDNDCFDFCMLMLSQARGKKYFQRYIGKYKQDSRRTIENERLDGTVDYFWYNEKSVSTALRDLEKMDGCMIQSRSWTGSGRGEHWGIYYNGYVYHFVGRREGIIKTDVKKFVGRVKKIRCIIKPKEIKQSRKFAQGATI